MYRSTAFNGIQLILVKDAQGLEASITTIFFPFVQTLSSLLGKQSIPPLIRQYAVYAPSDIIPVSFCFYPPVLFTMLLPLG